MNVMEWRSCLGSISRWHQCSLQAAYALWQYSLVGVPSCPANQSDLDSSSGRGMHLLEEDFAKSLVELPPVVLEFKKMDQAMGNVAEWLRWESANRPVLPALLE